MITYKKTFEDNKIVIYAYKPWGKGKGGFVEYDKETADLIKMVKAIEDDDGTYIGHLIAKIDKMRVNNKYEKDGAAIWA